MSDTYTVKKTISKSQIPSALVDKLKKLHGLPPYNGFTNFCRGDGYFAASIRRDFDSDLIEAAEALIIQPLQKKYQTAMDKIARM